MAEDIQSELRDFHKLREQEQAAKNAPQQEKKEEKGTLERVIDESIYAAKNVGAVAAEIAFPFMFSGEARTNAMINAYPLSLGARVDDIMAKKPIDLKANVKASKESFVGTAIMPPLEALFKYIEVARQYATNYAGAIPGAAAAVGALAIGQAAFVGLYTGLNHIVQNFSFKGLYTKFKNDYWPTMKRVWKYVLPFSAFNVLYLYQFGIAAQLAYGSLMTFLFRLVGPKSEGASLKNLFKAMNPVPYVKAAATAPTKLLSGLYKIVQNTGYSLGMHKMAEKPA
ncbi:Mpv17/PMP22 family protein [Candidatus Woesearchaeota archaeon]|nr:Mpv17/PMP22 family protein [Candidatus Woesearchaeota archaeon]